MKHTIGRNGRTFTHMNEPLRRANQAWMRQESGIITEKTGDFGAVVTKLIVISVVKKMTSLTINIERIL